MREVNRLRPEASVLVQGSHGARAKGTETRYRHGALLALFDARGKRLTDFEFSHLLGIGSGHLAYSTPQTAAERLPEDIAVTYSGLARYGLLQVDDDERKIGVLGRNGQRLTPPRYLCLHAIAPNAIWAVRADSCAPYRLPSMSWDITYQLTYGLIDSLGHEIIPFGSGPLSLADDARLLRRRNAPPRRPTSNATGKPWYPESSAVRYYRLNGQPAFVGEFTDATSFWQGRAIVRVGNRYGIIDTLGTWVTPLTDDNLRMRPRPAAQVHRDRLTDPLRLFDPLDAARKWWWQEM
ncbi:hypothetical protein DLM85_20380 [Hymenobacter edaphi]|uniref:WG repeat-containing protein n=1 Tax=Hymenobacter edaphi TaxID=2211146 RepID=A0A328BB90_9BACT|nr:hypothetical protein DLM85_20380 [Hymenobacter edaphi]